MIPAFLVPAEYFYAMTAHLPGTVPVTTRYQMVCTKSADLLHVEIGAAVDRAIIDPNDLVVNEDQAIRRLIALGLTKGPRCDVDAVVTPLISAWLAYTAADEAAFWTGAPAVQPALAQAHLRLAMAVITGGDATDLVTALGVPFAVPLSQPPELLPAILSVDDLIARTEEQWLKFFDGHANLLPDNTKPGTTTQRTRAFVRRLRRFFNVGTQPAPLEAGAPGQPPLFASSPSDPLSAFFSSYGSLPTPGSIDEGLFAASLAQVFPESATARAWLRDAAMSLIELAFLTAADLTPPSAPRYDISKQLQFSLMEALYARGFTRRSQIAALTLADFRAALVGTIVLAGAQDHAFIIYGRAGANPFAEPPASEFRPVNEGLLINCVPPAYRSPCGPFAYLQALLRVSETSSCADPRGVTPDGEALDGLLAERRGKLAELAVTQGNAETALPRIDLVNENLEYLVAHPDAAHGVVRNTASEQLAGHRLSVDLVRDALVHDPTLLLAALPEHSSPATPVAEPAAYQRLQGDFSAPSLPYAQAQDVSRSYLEQLCTSRYALLRRFRVEISEFVLSATTPAEFPSDRWRYPVRLEIAYEYLGMSASEATLFGAGEQLVPTRELYGFGEEDEATSGPFALDDLLSRLGLSYCELRELVSAQLVAIDIFTAHSEGIVVLPDCEPCCLTDYLVSVPEADLRTLALVVRLYRKLQLLPCARYSFVELRQILHALGGSDQASWASPEMLRQLAAFQMLRDDLGLSLYDPCVNPPAEGPRAIDLIALWNPEADASKRWAVDQLLERIACAARDKHRCGCRSPEFLKLLSENLDALAKLAGFAADASAWDARPSHTLRFAEVLQKLYASNFTVGELLFLFSADPQLPEDDPFPLSSDNEAIESPLDLPDDAAPFSLWELRAKLREVEVSDDEASALSWSAIVGSLQADAGYTPDPDPNLDALTQLGRHLFPTVLDAQYGPSAAATRQYRAPLALSATSAALWNTPEGPFRYDIASEQLTAVIPLVDLTVLEKLQRVRQLSAAEQDAIRTLYFAPRQQLAAFGFLFPDFALAERNLIQEPDERVRFRYFQRQHALFVRRAEVLARHLAEHVAQVTAHGVSDGPRLAARLLRQLSADENFALASWESDTGEAPTLTFPRPTGGAYAALLGLLGTGLLTEYAPYDACETGAIRYRELRGPLRMYGTALDRFAAPVPSVLPAMSLSLTADQLRVVGVRNGFALANADGTTLGSAEGFAVTLHGGLLIEEGGSYRFFAGAPTPDGEQPAEHARCNLRWRVSLRRGQRSWVLLSHNWPEPDGAPSLCSSPLPLRRGVYEVTVEILEDAPEFERSESLEARTTGFELKYQGPDSAGEPLALPFDKLFLLHKDRDLGDGIGAEEGAPEQPRAFLQALYRGSLRDIRRTYQRAFKSLLFAHRFGLRAEPVADDGQSELGYLLDHAEAFAGLAYYPDGLSGYTPHLAWFDPQLFPVRDNYRPPAPSSDLRVAPSRQRQQALFDWWERIFDYAELRTRAATASERPAWLLFHEAAEHHVDNPAHLLRHIGVDMAHASGLHEPPAPDVPPLVLTFYPDLSIDGSGNQLEDERWSIRVWRADEWLDTLRRKFSVLDIRRARPALWAADDPADEGGNENLTRFVRDGLIENGEPRRYAELTALNDGLRERARAALLAYLLRNDRVLLPWGGAAESVEDLSALLLMDVSAGLCQRVSRAEDAISSVQAFALRYRLGLEPSFDAHEDFARLWDTHYATRDVFCTGQSRRLYRENWIEWSELRTARQAEGFRLLEDKLRSASLSVAAPAALARWQSELPEHGGLRLLQTQEPSVLRTVHPPLPEGLSLMGDRERAGRRSWLAAIPGLEGTNGEGEGTVDFAALARLEHGERLPLWIESAVGLGMRFLRVAAAGEPLAAAGHGEPYGIDPCGECGRFHPPTPDEYYFWLEDAAHFLSVAQDAGTQSPEPGDGPDDESEHPAWHDEAVLPRLLDWPSLPMVHLCWARVHQGELKQSRRSAKGLRFQAGAQLSELSLSLKGRFADSLKLAIEPSADVIVTGLSGTDAPGFRYDLVTDTAEPLPLLSALPDGSEPSFLAGLPAYPYFLYFAAGAPLAPALVFSQALSVAKALRTHCRYEAALRWYAGAFSVLHEDARWCRPPRDDGNEQSPPVMDAGAEGDFPDGEGASDSEQEGDEGDQHACCRGGEVSEADARRRALTLLELETMLDWGDALMRQDTRERLDQARVVFDAMAKALGPAPLTTEAHAPDLPGEVVATFLPAGAALNPRLLALYERLAERRALLHACLDQRRLRGDAQAPYFGAAKECQETIAWERCFEESEWCLPACPYRFTFLLQRANELAAEVRGLGSALLAAYEKGDAEYLASLRSGQERQLLELTLDVRKEQWREADWQLQALGFTKEITQTRRRYTQGLIDAGLNPGESEFRGLTDGANAVRTGGNVSEVIAQVMHFIPGVHVGTSNFIDLPIGDKIAYVFEAIARIANSVSTILSNTAGLRLTEGGWDRREDEWRHLVEVYDLEIEQVERQILAAERRRDSALRELNNQQRQLENAAKVQDFLRDKFTSHELYLWLQQETAALYFAMYELALHAARRAQRALNYELGHTRHHMLPEQPWEDLHEGLLAGERLALAVKQMEATHLCHNVREYELVKHVSLRKFSALHFLQLKLTGATEVELPEWLFDLDYPGHYLRRIKSVSLTLPCVTGPYTGIQCRLTLLSSSTRIDPRLHFAHEECCPNARKPMPREEKCRCRSCCNEPASVDGAPIDLGYSPMPCDARIIRQYAATSAIATSRGVNDAGLFELNFRDERYLPFEFAGAVSRWRIELPPENNYFDFETLTDAVLHVSYTAREGGEPLAAAARQAAAPRLPDSGLRLFDVKHEWPDAWARFRKPKAGRQRAERALEIRIAKDDLTFLPGRNEINVVRIDILIRLATPHAAPAECRPACLEPISDKRAVHTLEWRQHDHHCGCACDGDPDCACCRHFVDCVESEEWRGLYHGVLEVQRGSLSSDDDFLATLKFQSTVGRVEAVYLLCGYRSQRLPSFRC